VQEDHQKFAADLPWGTIHASVHSHVATLLRWTTAWPRPNGALRYRCPINHGFVVVTDDETLAQLARPRARTRCPSCGENHLIARRPSRARRRHLSGPGAPP
jgi:hypothetical protein